MAEPAGVDDPDPDRHQQAREHRAGNVLNEARQTEEHRGKEQTVDHAREAGLSAGIHVDHGAHRGPGAGNAADQPGHHVSHALADELTVAVVPGTRQVVGDQRGQQ